MEQDCIFCKIIRGELPSEKVYEDDQVIAFLDIAPVAYGHTLVVPKEHYENFLETPEPLIAAMMEVTKRVARAVIAGVHADGWNFGINNGAAAGQAIFHAHWHVIPRSVHDGLQMWPEKKYAERAMHATADSIRSCMR